MNFLLSISPEEYGNNLISTKGLTETLLFGAQMLLLGMATVFAVLAIIWFSLTVFKMVFTEKKNAPKIEMIDEATNAPVSNISSSTDEEIVAVISAAIAAAEAESQGIKFRVVSFRRK